MNWAPLASPEFNQWLGGELQSIARDCRQRLGSGLVALILGGGYGRGQGGVWRPQGQECLYNDLDFFVLVEGRRLPDLREISRVYHQKLQIDVDFSPFYRKSQVSHWPASQMFYDLVACHRVIWGASTILTQWAPPLEKLLPPPGEAGRLLFNRGAGLLWSRRIARGWEPAPDPDFIRRNIHKAYQALGDATLLNLGAYHWDSAVRGQWLTQLGVDFELERYFQSLRFRLSPDSLPGLTESDLEQAIADWIRVFLKLESQRLGKHWDSPVAYLKEPRPRQSPSLRGWLSNLKRGRLGFAPPQDHLLRSLPSLLQGPTSEPESLAWLESWRRL